MRKLLVVLSLIMVASMVLAGCGPKATATAVPGATEAPTEAPTAAAPANPYLGSGQLDGNGIPHDFFADVHIRRAFSYSFDWTTYVNDVFSGEAVQSVSLPLPGMPGFDPTAEHYTLDLDKAAAEFKLADLDHDGIAAGDETDDSDVWNLGFRLQMLYNQGNTTRQIVSEILAANLSQVNEKFSVEILGLPWPAYLTAQRAFQIPIMTAGWQEDIHDPHNWYQPYTTGAYGSRQSLPDDLKATFKAFLDEGVGLTDAAARAEVYYQANKAYFDNAPGVPLVTATSHGFEQKWLEGRIYNPIFSGDYYATMTKAAGAKNPDTITQATIGDSDTFDPALAYDTASGEIIQNVYETLVFYDGAATDKFVPQLAESWDVSADGTVYTFNIRQGVKFHNGDTMTPSDVAYSFVRGLLQGGYASPQWLLAEPFYGVGMDDVNLLVDPEGNLADDRDGMVAADPAALVAACEQTKAAIVADDAAGTVTMTLAQSWGPFFPTIAQSWGSILDQKWVVEQGGWDGSCDTWQNFYAMQSADDPISQVTNGTGPYKLDHWAQGTEIVLTRNDAYWGTPASNARVSIQIIPEWGTRFAMLQAGDADFVDVPVENRSQADALVGEFRTFDSAANAYGPVQQLCGYDSTKIGIEKFTACAEGETGTGGPLRLNIGRPGLVMDVVIYNFAIR
ncbi:MAG: ABC transporter substrate-binding protein [Chloroflexota bacterium]